MARLGRSYPISRVLHSRVSGGNANPSSSDTGTGNESQSISATLSSADTGTGTEGTARIAFTQTDTGTGLEGTPLIGLTGTDTGTGNSSQSISAALTSTDTATGAEGTARIGFTSADTATGAEGVPNIGATWGDTASATEGWSITDLTPPAPPAPSTAGFEGDLVQGPGTIYVGAYGALEPANGSVVSGPDPLVWTDVGGLLGGVELSVDQEFFEVELKQIPDRPMKRLKKRRLTIKTQMAEPTLTNLAYALNDTPSVSAGTGWSQLVPSDRSEASILTYTALIIDGWAPGFNATSFKHKRRRIIVRKCLSIDNVQFAYSKDGQTVYTVTWSCHYVSSSIAPFRIIDEA